MFSIWVLLTYIGVLFSIITFLFGLFIFRPWFSLWSANSYSICCSSCVVGEATMTIIFAVYLQASGFLILSSEYAFECCGKQLGRCDISLSYSSPDVDFVDSHRAIGVDFLQEFDVHIFYPLSLKRGQYCISLHWVEGFLVVDECDAEWDIIFSALLLQLVCDVDLVCRWVFACSHGWFSSNIFSSLFVSTFVSTL